MLSYIYYSYIHLITYIYIYIYTLMPHDLNVECLKNCVVYFFLCFGMCIGALAM